MSLERFSLIRNVGQFDNVSSGAQMPLTPFSVIYAENGRGKTTLAAILKSLSAGEPTLILNRKRLKAQHPPHVVLQMSGSTVTFQDGNWSAVHPEIAVFDDAFVADNVCSGIEIGASHRQNLHELILGAQGVALSKTLQRHVDRIEEHNKALRAKQDAISPSVRGSFTVDAFCGLTKDAEIDKRIEEGEQRLAAAKASDDIRQRSAFHQLSLPSFDCGQINTILGRSLPDLEAGAAARVRGHLRKLGKGGEAWVAEGVPRIASVSESTSEEVCPFCAQALDASSLIPHYQAYFSHAYAKLKADIRETGQGIVAAHGGDVPAAFERAVRDAAEARDFWKAFTAIPDIYIDTAAVVRAWTTAREAVLSVLRAKAAAPLDPMQLSQEVQRAVAAYDAERAKVAEATEAFLVRNDQIRLVKEQAASADISALEADLVRLKAMKSRFEPAVAAQCEAYLAEKAEKGNTETARKQARKALDHYRETIFPAYEVAINVYLSKFNAGFRLQAVSSAQ